MCHQKGGDSGSTKKPPEIVGWLDCSTVEAFTVSVHIEGCV
jgi:hypothetical protein